MKKALLTVICLLILQCEQGWLENIIDPTVLGCNVDTACNYDPDVNENDGTCEFLSCKDCLGYPHGIAVLDSCGTCDASLLVDCTQDCAGIWVAQLQPIIVRIVVPAISHVSRIVWVHGAEVQL